MKQPPGSWMDDNGACKVCDGEIPYGHSENCDVYKMQCQIKHMEELHVMQLAAISTATVQNTEATLKDRIDKTSPYWTVAYMDTCVAVDREMRERKRALEGVREGMNKAVQVLSELENKVYVGVNPIREGLKRGFSEGSIAILEAISKL